MKKRRIIKGFVVSVVIIVSIVVIVFLVLIHNSSSFLIEEKLLDSRTTKDGQLIEVYYKGGGATVNEVVQVKRKYGKEFEILDVFENYNHGRISSLSDSSLTVILSYTSEGQPDTVLINLK